MPVVNGVAIMGWDYWSLFNANSYIPTFGLFGGPGYIGGHRFDGSNRCIDDPFFTIADAFNTPPALNSSGDASHSDAAFKAHDLAYYGGNGQTNEAALILQADYSLLQSIANVFLATNYHMDRQEIVYDLLAARLFESKIEAFNLAMAGLEEIKNASQNLLNAIIDSAEAYTISHLTLSPNPETGTTITGDIDPVNINDSLGDTTGSDRIEGRSGNDDIYSSHGGSDWLLGGDGMDSVVSQNPAGKDILEGNAGSDILWGGPDDDKVFGGNYDEMETLIEEGETAQGISEKGDLASGSDGDDFVYGTNAMDLLLGGDGHDLIIGGGGDDVILGDDDFTYATRDWTSTIITYEENVWAHEHRMTGIDYVLSVNPGDDTIYAGAGNDFVNAGGGNDEVYAGDGDDAVFGSRGDDFIEGGEGNDILIGDEFSLPIAEQGNDYIDGGAGDDMIRGDSGSDNLFGGDGNDTIYGDGEVDDERAGGDYIDGEAGEDMIYGGAGSDTIFGGADNDYIEGDGLTAGDDYIDGEEGIDTIIGAGGSDQIYGGDGDDILHGDAGNVPLIDQGGDYIEGGAGNDIIKGYAGSDQLYGDDGNDTIDGDSGNDYIEGGAGDDYIQAGEGDNTMYGGDGSDRIQSGAGNDYIEGGAGTDTIVAGDGANTIYGNDGNDQISSGGGDDHIDAGSGNDVVYGNDGADTVYGGSGADTVYAGAGDDYIDGGSEADYMYGGTGNDTYVVDNSSDWVIEYTNQGSDTVRSSIAYTLGSNMENLILTGSADINGTGNSLDNMLEGNSGNNTLSGEEGNDIYLFGRGSGVDTINNFSSDFLVKTTDAVRLGAGVPDTDLELIRENYNLRINIKGTADSLIIRDYYCGERHIVDQFMLADGAVMTAAQMEGMVAQVYDTSNTIRGTANDDMLSGLTGEDRMFGDAGNDTISGSSGNDVLHGGAGVDVLQGGLGNDTYIFNVGDGVDLIDNNASDNTKTTDTVAFGTGISPGDIEIYVEGNNLRIAVKDSTDSIVVKDARWYNESSNDRYPYMVDQFTFADSTIMAADQLEAKGAKAYGSGGRDLLVGLSGDDQIFGYGGDDQLEGSRGNDIFDGGSGNDRMAGGYGSDTYKINKGTGVDTIYNYYESDSATATDSVAFGEAITPDDLELFGEGNDLRINIRGTSDSLIIKDGLGDMTSYIDQFQFADGTILTPSQLKEREWTVHGSAGNDVLFGGGKMFGYDGDDKINGGNGNDVIDGGKGNDTLYGAAGDDTYIYGIGNGVDTLSGTLTTSTVEFGEGITADGLQLIQDGNNFRINITGTLDSLIIKDWFSSDIAKVGHFTFSDNTVLTAAQMEAKGYSIADAGMTYYGTYTDDLINGGGGHDRLFGYDGTDILYGNAGDDSLSGGSGSDVLDGGAGFDTLQGDGGNDIYKFGRGSGVDSINNNAADYMTTTDIVEFGEGITSADLDLAKEGYDLRINIAGGTDSLIIRNWYSGDSCKVDQFRFADSTVLTAAQMEAMAWKVHGTAGGESLNGTSANNTMYGYGGDDNLSAGAGDDILDGGKGNDTLQGDTGNDTYKFGRGSGADRISNGASDYASTTDTVEFGAGIAVNDLELLIDSAVGYNNVKINIKGSSDSLMIDNWFNGDMYKVDRFLFADNTELTAAQLEAMGSKVYGPYHNGSRGNDQMYGFLGDDTYKFGRGSGVDTIYNYARDYATTMDTVEFGAEITATDLKLVKYRDDLKINITGATDSLIMNNWFKGDAYKVDRFKFANGSVMTAAQLEAMGYETSNTIYGTPNDDYLTGSELDEQIIGYEGNDTMIGGGGNDIIEGGAGNDILDGGAGADTLIGGAGSDTYGVDDIEDVISESANEGLETVRSFISYKLGANLENLTLAGSDAVNGSGNELDNVLIGNGADNVLSSVDGNDIIEGGAGNDILYGGTGVDTMIGGTGSDILDGGAGDDSYIINLGDGIDTIVDLASAYEGNTLVFGQGISPDDLRLEIGSLIIRIGTHGDRVQFDNFDPDDVYGTHAVDRYEFSDGSVLSYSELIELGFDISGTPESDQIRGTNAVDRISALDGDDAITSGAGDDIIIAGEGNDTLDGGEGADVMKGDAGNDTYLVDNAGDVVIESAGEGTDTVRSSISYMLGAHVENLTLTGNDPLDGAGNDGTNALVGNEAANTLSGGAGNDTLQGGGGDDRYLYNVGDGLDVIADSSGMDTIALGQGIDYNHAIVRMDDSTAHLRVLDADYNETFSGIDITRTPDGAVSVETASFTNGATYDLSHLVVEARTTYGTDRSDILITGRNDDTIYAMRGSDIVYTGTGNDTLYGGEGSDILFGDGGNDALYGENGADILYGGGGTDVLDGGAGADCMAGGSGNDTYIIDNSSDVAVECADEGIDLLRSSISCTLSLHVENLTLTGSGNITGTGNGLDNVITGNSGCNNLKGNSGNDTLDGNAGNDSLTGGNGSDMYMFRRTDGRDTINETAGITGDTDTVHMTDGISRTEPVIVKQNNDLYLFIDSNNYMKVSNQFTQPNYGVERLEVTDGYYITRTDIENIVNTMSAINNDPGMDVVQKFNAMRIDQTYISTLAQNWHQQ